MNNVSNQCGNCESDKVQLSDEKYWCPLERQKGKPTEFLQTRLCIQCEEKLKNNPIEMLYVIITDEKKQSSENWTKYMNDMGLNEGKAFIEKYLRTCEIPKDVKYFKQMYKDAFHTSKICNDTIAEYIRSLDYKLFLQTAYWKLIRNHIKYLAKHKCSMCYGNEKLSVHHRTYANHGKEHLCLSDLICLCEACHTNFHKVKQPK